MEQLIEERDPYYNKVLDYLVSADDQTVDEVLAFIESFRPGWGVVHETRNRLNALAKSSYFFTEEEEAFLEKMFTKYL